MATTLFGMALLVIIGIGLGIMWWRTRHLEAHDIDDDDTPASYF